MEADFAGTAWLLANRHRARFVDCLMSGVPRSAGDLARLAGIAASTASEHLALLVGGGLLVRRREGRRTIYEIASPEVAGAIEALSLASPAEPPRSSSRSRDEKVLASLRTCYDHLAGAVAVALFDSVTRRGWLSLTSDGVVLTDAGERGFARLGIDVDDAKRRRRAFALTCIDWTERRPHLAGALGKSLADAFLENDWARRRSRTRGLLLTPGGRENVAKHFRIVVEDGYHSVAGGRECGRKTSSAGSFPRTSLRGASRPWSET